MTLELFETAGTHPDERTRPSPAIGASSSKESHGPARALVVGATGHDRPQHRRAPGRLRLGSLRHVPRRCAGRGRRRHAPSRATSLDPAAVDAAVAEQVRATHLFYCTWSAAGHRGRGTSRSTARCCGTCWTPPAATGTLRARRARHRPQALPRPVRGLRAEPGQAAVPGEPGAPGLQELLLRARRTSSSPRRTGTASRWSVHRPHTVIGYALGNAMNMGVTLAVYGTIGAGDRAAVRLPRVAGAVRRDDRRHRRAAAGPAPVLGGHRPGRRERGVQLVNGDAQCRRHVGGRRSGLGVEPAPYPGHPTPLVEQMARRPRRTGGTIAERHGLARARRRPAGVVVAHRQRPGSDGRDRTRTCPRAGRPASPTSRTAVGSFLDLFDRLRQERVIPEVRAVPMKAVQFQGVEQAGARRDRPTEDRRRRGAGDVCGRWASATPTSSCSKAATSSRSTTRSSRATSGPGEVVEVGHGRHRLQARRPRPGRVRHRDGALRLLHLRRRRRVLRRAARVAAPRARRADPTPRPRSSSRSAAPTSPPCARTTSTPATPPWSSAPGRSGSSCVAVASTLGARVIAAEPNAARADLARQLGAEDVVDPTDAGLRRPGAWS